MGYCTVQDVQRILPEKVTIGNSNIGAPVPGRPSSRSNFSPSDVKYFIDYAQQRIDSRLRNQYICPLRRVKTFETTLESNVSAGSNVSIAVHDSGAFLEGMLVRLQDKNGIETTTVESVSSLTTVILASVLSPYESYSGKISILEYPDPIPVITARLACSYLLDKLFVAEQSPDVSQYGSKMRNMANASIDDILTGKISLFGQEVSGWRFMRGTLQTAYRSAADVEVGQEKEG